MNMTVSRSCLHGSVCVPGSKSHTIRAVLLAAMAEGTTVIHNPLPSLDGKSALAAAETFGARTSIDGNTWTVEGRGRDLAVPRNYLDCGNSGSVAYFATPMAALVDGYTFVTGDAQIRRRPIHETVLAINELGGFAAHSIPGSDSCPVVVHGVMKGGQAHFGGKLSQIISGFMMAAPLLEQDTELLIEDIRETPYLQITIDWMKRFGVELEHAEDFSSFQIRGKRFYRALETTIPSDWSAVAFPLIAGLITDSELVIDAVDFNDSQGDKAVVDHLIAMGADLTKDVEGHRLLVRGGRKLRSGLTIDMKNIPDALPALSVAAAYAEGDTTFTGLAHVRLKETDRVAVMKEELEKIGVTVEIGPDSMVVHGGCRMHAAQVESHDDHRVAMAMLVCGLGIDGETVINGAECAAVSFPSFFEVMEKAGAKFARG